MSLSDADQKMFDLTLGLARFAATGVALLIASNHRQKPFEDRDVQTILNVLASCAAGAPEESKDLFDSLADTVAGKHYG